MYVNVCVCMATERLRLLNMTLILKVISAGFIGVGGVGGGWLAGLLLRNDLPPSHMLQAHNFVLSPWRFPCLSSQSLVPLSSNTTLKHVQRYNVLPEYSH